MWARASSLVRKLQGKSVRPTQPNVGASVPLVRQRHRRLQLMQTQPQRRRARSAPPHTGRYSPPILKRMPARTLAPKDGYPTTS